MQQFIIEIKDYGTKVALQNVIFNICSIILHTFCNVKNITVTHWR